MNPMPWRLAVAGAILLAGPTLSWAEATSLPSAVGALPPLSARRFDNDNNLVDDLFQNFNGNESDDGGRRKKATVGPLPAPVSAPAPQASGTSAQARARAGRETPIFLANDRVVLRIPAGLPEDLEVAILVVEPPAASPPPGPVIGGLVFRLSAQPFGGDDLKALPIEANLSARYTDAELGARDESRLTISWLDPADGRWKPAPKLAAAAQNNFISATIQALGLYAVHQAP